eukprot:g33677.t1
MWKLHKDRHPRLESNPGPWCCEAAELTTVPPHVAVTVKKAQQHLFFLRQLRKFGISIRSLTNFYTYTIKSILSGCITAWYGNCSAQDHKKLQKVVCTVQTITEANLPSMDSIYKARCLGKVANIIKDPSRP